MAGNPASHGSALAGAAGAGRILPSRDGALAGKASYDIAHGDVIGNMAAMLMEGYADLQAVSAADASAPKLVPAKIHRIDGDYEAHRTEKGPPFAVGSKRNPPVRIKDNDGIEVGLSQLGRLRNFITAETLNG
jgi:hypothetical protein